MTCEKSQWYHWWSMANQWIGESQSAYHHLTHGIFNDVVCHTSEESPQGF